LLLYGVIYFVAQSPNAITGIPGTFDRELAAGNVQAFGRELLTTFVFPFELTALVLLVAMIGAVSLGRRITTTQPPFTKLEDTEPTAEAASRAEVTEKVEV
jgi:NADH:ubiquinone oxidoreductase subunit 6 (subunit J)